MFNIELCIYIFAFLFCSSSNNVRDRTSIVSNIFFLLSFLHSLSSRRLLIEKNFPHTLQRIFFFVFVCLMLMNLTRIKIDPPSFTKTLCLLRYENETKILTILNLDIYTEPREKQKNIRRNMY